MKFDFQPWRSVINISFLCCLCCLCCFLLCVLARRNFEIPSLSSDLNRLNSGTEMRKLEIYIGPFPTVDLNPSIKYAPILGDFRSRFSWCLLFAVADPFHYVVRIGRKMRTRVCIQCIDKIWSWKLQRRWEGFAPGHAVVEIFNYWLLLPAWGKSSR